MRILAFLGMFFVVLYAPFWFFLLCVIAYTCFYSGYELLGIALVIDAQFGEVGRAISSMYTLSVLAIVVCMVFVKPHLRFYS